MENVNVEQVETSASLKSSLHSLRIDLSSWYLTSSSELVISSWRVSINVNSSSWADTLNHQTLTTHPPLKKKLLNYNFDISA